MKSYPTKFKIFRRKIVQMGALQKLQNSIQTLIILWPVYPIHTNSLFWVIFEELTLCHFSLLNTFIRGKDSLVWLIFHLNILVFQTNGKQPYSFPVLSRFCNGLFHLTILTHSQSQVLAVRYLPCTKWRQILITALLWIVNSRSIGVTRISMYSYHSSVAASQAKCMFWLLTALKDNLFPDRIWNVLFVIRFERGVWSYKANIWERSAQNNPLY